MFACFVLFYSLDLNLGYAIKFSKILQNVSLLFEAMRIDFAKSFTISNMLCLVIKNAKRRAQMAKKGVKILLLEDDLLLGEMLCDELKEKGYLVTHCENAQSALEIGYEQAFDLWIFDVKVPLGNGFEVLKELRGLGKNTPTIFLTSLSMIEDLKQGFLAGCDDYLRKPFDVDELLLRVDCLLKRSFAHQNSEILELSENHCFDILQKTLFDKHTKKEIPLTNKERELLALLLQNRGNFVSQDEIFERIWSYDESPTNMALRVYIKNLRKVLGSESIATQRHRGYCYAK